MKLTDQKTLLQILKLHNLWAKKSFGQNFLVNEGVLTKIIETAEIQKTDQIVEIGPGLGALTLELVKLAKHVTSIELDFDLIPILRNHLNDFKNYEIINTDALRFPPPKKAYKVVANIPYNITSPLINHFLQNENKPDSMTLLVQQEVAQKICKLDPDMSVLSLQVALFGKARLIKIVKAGNFYPAPKVDSAILHIEVFKPENKSYIRTEEALKILQIAKKAFSGQRKMLSNTLPEHKESLIELNLQNERPQHLTISDWKNIIA